MPRKIIPLFGDALIAFVSIYMGLYLRLFSGYTALLEQYHPVLPKAVLFALVMVIMCFIVDLYNFEREESRKETFLKILFAALFTAFALAALYYFIPEVRLGRGILFLALCATILLQSLWHIGYGMFIKLPAVGKRILILGTGPIARVMGNLLVSKSRGIALAGYVSCYGEPMKVPESEIVGNGEGLLDIALKERVQQIVVSLSERRGTLPVREVLNCKLRGIDVIDGPSFYEKMTGKLLIESLNPSHIIFSKDFRITTARRCFKRMIDVLFSALWIVILAPVMLLVSLLIKLDSRGPILFRQERVGEGEKHFMVYKFRTMIEGAELATGPVWSSTGDKRITRIGKILRQSRLDEIPQLFNVIRGDMSFIGPRPERPFFVESLIKQIPYYSERHCIKPGITGWAQVSYEYGDSVEDAIEKLRYDLYYIKYQSIALDLLIVLDTIKVVLFGRGR